MRDFKHAWWARTHARTHTHTQTALQPYSHAEGLVWLPSVSGLIYFLAVSYFLDGQVDCLVTCETILLCDDGYEWMNGLSCVWMTLDLADAGFRFVSLCVCVCVCVCVFVHVHACGVCPLPCELLIPLTWRTLLMMMVNSPRNHFLTLCLIVFVYRQVCNFNPHYVTLLLQLFTPWKNIWSPVYGDPLLPVPPPPLWDNVCVYWRTGRPKPKVNVMSYTCVVPAVKMLYWKRYTSAGLICTILSVWRRRCPSITQNWASCAASNVCVCACACVCFQIQGSICPHAIIILPNSSGTEVLVCYEDEGVFIDTYGRITKDTVLQWGEMPASVGKVPPPPPTQRDNTLSQLVDPNTSSGLQRHI